MIRYATQNDTEFLNKHDHHITLEMLNKKITDKEYIVALNEKEIIGYLRFNFFWDNTPFVNLIHVCKQHRKKGIGKELMSFFAKEMKNKDYNLVMTSTLSDENAQHFYRKLGYKDSGCLMLENEALEIIFVKKI